MSADALYLHIPFCTSKCPYCDFVSFATRRDDPLMEVYARALALQIDEAAEAGLLETPATAYIGGGTPSYAGEGIVGLASRTASSGSLSELTVEANPESLTFDLSLMLRESGVSRLSIGVQSLNDAELSALGRAHDARTALSALNRAVELGFDVSADLMCAIPLQTPSSWLDTLEGVLAAGVSHVSVYPLMIEEGTVFARAVAAGERAVPDDGDEALRMEEAEALLSSRGFARYEVASYAKKGHACLHNQAYWTGISYLGLGTGAASMFGREDFPVLARVFPQLGKPPADAARIRLSCTTDRAYLAAHPALSEQSLAAEYLDTRESLAEDLMLGARMARGLSPELVSRARDVMGAELDGCLSGLIADGYLTGSLAPTRRGWLLGNELYGRLWGLAGV